jgi:hypothetical protein
VIFWSLFAMIAWQCLRMKALKADGETEGHLGSTSVL